MEVDNLIIDRLSAFLGLPYKLNEYVSIYSPTIREIALEGYIEYMIKLQLSSFQKEKILLDLFKLDQDTYSSIENEDDFDVLTNHPTIAHHISSALSFFCKSNVHYDELSASFVTDNEKIVVNKDNYSHISSVIKELNGITDIQASNLKPRSSKAKQLLEKMMAFEKKESKTDDGLELKDILSILCSAKGNGINVFNVMDLTIYQVYEQFERMNVKENHDRLLPVWANGYLPETKTLPEWIIKTKL